MAIPLGVFEFHYLTSHGSMDLIPVRRIIARSMTFTSMDFSDIDGTTVSTSETIFRWLRRVIISSAPLRILAAILGYTILLQLALGLSRSRIPVLGTNCIGCLERQVYLASRGERNVKVVLTTFLSP